MFDCVGGLQNTPISGFGCCVRLGVFVVVCLEGRVTLLAWRAGLFKTPRRRTIPDVLNPPPRKRSARCEGEMVDGEIPSCLLRRYGV